MLLSKEELQSLVEAKNRSPHQLLGLHPLGDGSGLVARVIAPSATAVKLKPLDGKQKPTIELTRLHNSFVFEGVTKDANRVYDYQLEITDQSGHQKIARDPYAFASTLGEADLYLFGKG